MEFKITNAPAHRQRGDCVVVAAHGPRRLCPSAKRLDEASGGVLSRWLRASGFRGDAGKTLLLHELEGTRAKRVLVVGCGKSNTATQADFRKALRSMLGTMGAAGVRRAASYLGEVQVANRDGYWKVRQSVEAALDSIYRFDRCKSDPAKAKTELGTLSMSADEGDREPVSHALAHGNAIARGVRLAKDLGNLPGNICTPSFLAEEAERLASRHESVTARVQDEAALEELAMGSLLSVSRGSSEPACLIELEYRGAPRSQAPTVLVGKGVTFDSGGISIKPSSAMDEMKFDMCGAASTFGAVEAAATLALPINLVGLVPATENLPGGKATKPGDIVTSMSGQTIEILNTDAEGRLILCDALTFATRFKPEVVIDIATLTGACVIALGSHASGLFSNDGPLTQSLVEAGKYAGDRAWPMPLWPEYGEALESNFADVANVGGREAGAITAAAFLARFAESFRWAHLDIAGTAWRGGKQKGATGRPVRLLVQYLLDRAGETPGDAEP